MLLQKAVTTLLLLALTTLCCINAIPLAEFYPFREAAGDTLIPPNDDGSSELITLNRVFPFYGIDHFVIVVNNNGLISFGTPQTAFTSLAFPLPNDDTQLIAPFWGDVDTTGTGRVWYRETLSQADRDRAQTEIRAIFPEASRFTPRMVFIATWDHVGHFRSNTERTNTFQCILVSDGFMSYVIFLYADGLIQWTTGDASGGTNGFGGTQAQIGFNAGDMINFASHPFSQTQEVINIASSRVPDTVMRDGMLMYRVDGTVISECMEDENAELVLSPRLGNQLGGTPVLIRGLCLEPTDFIACVFNGRATPGEYYDANTAVCATPIITTTGEVDVLLRRTRPRDMRRIDIGSSFTTVSPIRAHHVAFVDESVTEEMQLYLKAHDTITLRWMPNELIPSYLTEDDISNIAVSVELHQQILVNRQGQENWRAIPDSSRGGLTNSGQASYTIPTKLVMMNCPDQNQLCPVAFRVSATVPIPLRGVQTEQKNVNVGIWSAVAFLQADGATEASLSQICETWAAPPPPEDDNRIPTSRLSQLPQCPPMLQQAQQDNRFRREVLSSALSALNTEYENAAMKFFAPNAVVCYIQIVMEGREGQQCCYGNNGALVTGQPGGGSVDGVSPMMNFALHNLNDLLPYAYCCRGGQRCNQYDALRPSRQLLEAPPYQLPVPACVFGDPHIVTLDEFKYTFNGKGEFTLVETLDQTFTLQGRMEQPMDASNNAAPGTVFTAIVAQQVVRDVGKRVEFQVSRQGSELDVLVDGNRVNFAEQSEQSFQGAMVTNLGNNTVLAEFVGGSSIEIRVQNSIIAVMLVTLPLRYQRTTRGLMGNYNEDDTDDLVPKHGTSRLPPDASMEEIFTFGNTWIITEESESLFAYNRPGEAFGAFNDATFTPTFEAEFDDPALEQRAQEVCGDDQFCLFDIAATRNENIGMSTMMDVREFDVIVDLAEPIVCVPGCGEGVCVATNSCACAVGYTGERCTQRILSACELEMCQNNGTCVQHVRSFTCTCPEGFIGIFCQEREPPLSLKLINSSPRTFRNITSLDFIPSQPLESANCILINTTETDCTSGQVRFRNVPPGYHELVIEAKSVTGEEAIFRRTVFICAASSGSCGVNLINEGVSVSGDCVLFQFTACGPVQFYTCSLDSEPFKQCLSPLRYCGLAQGQHRLRVQPDGEECEDIGGLTTQFDII